MRRLVVLAVAVVLGVTACGGSGKKSSTGAASTGNSAASSGKPAGTVNFTGSFCGDGKQATQSDAFGAAPGANEQATLQKNLDLLKKFESEAPSEIKSDVTQVVTFYSKFVQAMAGANGDPQKMAAALAPLQSEEASLTAAGQRIEAYVTAHCK